MTGSPCKGCEDRHAGCHAECETYLEWQAGVVKEREARNEQSYINYQIESATYDKWLKWRQRRLK